MIACCRRLLPPLTVKFPQLYMNEPSLKLDDGVASTLNSPGDAATDRRCVGPGRVLDAGPSGDRPDCAERSAGRRARPRPDHRPAVQVERSLRECGIRRPDVRARRRRQDGGPGIHAGLGERERLLVGVLAACLPRARRCELHDRDERDREDEEDADGNDQRHPALVAQNEREMFRHASHSFVTFAYSG